MYPHGGWRSATRLTVAAVLAVLVSLPALMAHAGTEPVPMSPAPSLRFDRITIEEGLAQNSVYAILQDRRGYMWFATEDGLHRYDGYRFHIYRHDPADPHSISDNFIVSLLEAADGSIWVGTYNRGLNRYDPLTDRFTRYRHDAADAASLANDIILALAEDGQGHIWVGTDDGLDRLDPATGRFTHFRAGQGPASALLHNRIWSLYRDSRDTIWIGTQYGLNYLLPAEGTVHVVDVPSRFADWLRGRTISAIREDSARRLWVGVRKGLLLIDEEKKVIKAYGAATGDKRGLSNADVRTIVPSRRGDLWIGTYGGGLNRFDPDTETFEVFRHDPVVLSSLNSDYIVAGYEDATGVIWLGTDTAGAARFNPATRIFAHFRHHPIDKNSLLHSMVWAVFRDSRGMVWIGTEAGLSRLDRKTGRYTHYRHAAGDPTSIPEGSVVTIGEDPEGYIWVGAASGLARLDPRTGKFRRYKFEYGSKEETLSANSVSTLAFDAEGRLWVGTLGGIFILDRTTGSYRHLRHDPTDPDSLSNNGVYVIHAASDGTMWVGTEEGLNRYNPATETFTKYQHRENDPASLSHDSILAILVDSGGTLWVGTSNGLNRFDAVSGRFEHFTEKNGLPNNTIYGIQEDDTGQIWLSTNAGLARLDPRTGRVRTYRVTDGLQSNEFNGGASFRAPDGEMFFGGINGFNAFFPSAIREVSLPPKVAVTHLAMGTRTIDLPAALASGEPLVFRHYENFFTFEFAAFDFSAPDKNSFQFMLEGLDTAWRDGGNRNHITYTNIEPGKYVFRVRGANAHGVWSEKPASVSFVVLPPPWKTWWAYLIYTMVTLGFAAYVVRAHNRRLAREHQLETERHKRRWAENLHQLTQSLSSSLDAHQIAEQLMLHLRGMVNYRTAVLFVERGIDIELAGCKGFSPERERELKQFPETHSRLLADIRHTRRTVELGSAELEGTPLVPPGSMKLHYLAVPTYSRAEEFALLLVGREEVPFSEQEKEIISAFAKQALVALDNARLFAEVQNLATTDNLTKVSNRRHFFEMAELEFARSRRYGRSVSVILLDADNFKEINEKYGHDIGDRVLKIIAGTCRANLRHFDIIGRYGGEDFIIMLPETPLNVAADVADRLRKSIESVVIDTHKGELRVTVSLGVALATDDVQDLATLINRADTALYEAKRSGRNRVVVAEHAL